MGVSGGPVIDKWCELCGRGVLFPRRRRRRSKTMVCWSCKTAPLWTVKADAARGVGAFVVWVLSEPVEVIVGSPGWQDRMHTLGVPKVRIKEIARALRLHPPRADVTVRWRYPWTCSDLPWPGTTVRPSRRMKAVGTAKEPG